MGRKKLYKNFGEKAMAHRLAQRKYYKKHAKKLRQKRMERYYATTGANIPKNLS